jgi:hypothetical protein
MPDEACLREGIILKTSRGRHILKFCCGRKQKYFKDEKIVAVESSDISKLQKTAALGSSDILEMQEYCAVET